MLFLSFSKLIGGFAALFSSLTFSFATPADYSPGVISAPANGTAIAPGQSFNFTYNIHGDYCTSSYDFSVWLITDTPTSMQPSENFMNGYYFGTFAMENYPAVPNPSNPAPSQLKMPDFSKNEGGFGGGQSASDASFQLMVMEEWDTCDGTLGRKISIALNTIIYNVTSKGA
ncbi:hypothetical protein OF83DRAFT_1130316 [Amylostereum chailletii]|nr:hypothetical protein OF83DRAFT_1130316 [Amylostereum chailletii]